jgi:hypothetical protein
MFRLVRAYMPEALNPRRLAEVCAAVGLALPGVRLVTWRAILGVIKWTLVLTHNNNVVKCANLTPR